MGMAVNKAGDGNHAGAVNNGLRGIRRSVFFNGDNFAAVNADVSAKQDFQLGVHGHNGDIGD